MAADINTSGVLKRVATSPSSVALLLILAIFFVSHYLALSSSANPPRQPSQPSSAASSSNPLTPFPGPYLWSATRIPYAISLLRGTLNDNMRALHARYGPVIRIAPNELSFACEEAWHDIYAHRPGHAEVRKDPGWYLTPNDMPQNIVTTSDIRVRARMRRLLAPSFSTRALRDQAPVVEAYVEKCLQKLGEVHDALEGSEERVVNMLDWINFLTVDVIGDLALGESFHCLESSNYHPWVKTMYNFFKGMVLLSAAKFFPVMEWLLQRMVPKEILKRQEEHTLFTNEKILQRIESKSTRPDFMTPFLKDMEKTMEKMSIGEIQSTFAIVIVAGSETVATSLCGILFKLATHPHIQQKLWVLLSERFASKEEITIAATSDIDYLDAVINEGLRLCYAIPGGLPRVAPTGGDVFAGHYVPGGTSISIRPYVVFHSEKYFHRAWEFHPERWLEHGKPKSDFANDRLSAVQAFSVGPTNCIGKSLAWAEMRQFVSRIVWEFELSMSAEKPFKWEDQRMMMIVEKNPLWLAIERRERVCK